MVKQSIKFIVAGILATLFVTGATTGHAQNYPVQAFATLTPPYSLKLSDYAAPEGNRMRITLLLKDAQQPTLDVRLKLTIEGNGVKLTTNPSFQPTPITLLSSTLYEVSYDELSDYFLPQNLIADGISMSALTSSGMLPEGLYRFKVEAMEAHRDVPVSNTAMAIGWLMLNDPPQWISPRQGQKLTAGEPQGIQFLWSRCGMSSPNAALSTQYEVTMVEMVQPNMDPNVAIVTLPPIYQEVSPIENLFYGPDKPELIPGHSYAVRIRAFDTRGIDLYRNGGYSPVITFRYGDPCIAPVFLSSDNISEQTADLSWNSTPLATNYRVRFRENGTDLSDWYEEPATQTSYTVKNLKPDCTYEYQVQSECGSLPSDYSVSGTLRTRKLENQNQTCSQQLDNASMPTNRDPLSALHTNQTFLAGVMPVKVTSVQGSNGIFTGTGVVYLPIAGVGLSCTFNKVGINTNYQLISGEVITTKSKNTAIYGSGGVTVLDTLHLDNPIDTIIVNPNGDVAVVSGGDTTFIPLANQPVVIYPPTGGGAGTTTGGTIGNGGGDGAGAGGSTGGGGTTIYGDGPLIVENGTVKPYNPEGDLPTALFHKASMSTYGYDSLAYEALRSYYPVATINGKEVGIPYKALPVSGSDNVVLELKPGSSKLTTDSLTIDVQTNAKVMSRSVMGNNKLMVSLQGLSEGEEPIMVRYTKHDADGKTEQVDIGAAKAVVYQPQPMKLVVVPLAGTTAPDAGALQSQLTAIYGQAVTSWTVTVTAPFGYTIPGGQLEFGSSEMASSYTEGMNNLIDAYKVANPSLEDGTYYLFVVPRFSDATLQGYMPRARRFGFIAQSSTDARTLAHELGHGAFNLEHTFPVLPQGTTDNLMDYNGGTRLIKPQWDLIHNPEMTTGLLDDETDGASTLSKKIYFIIDSIGYQNGDKYVTMYDNRVVNIRIAKSDSTFYLSKVMWFLEGAQISPLKLFSDTLRIVADRQTLKKENNDLIVTDSLGNKLLKLKIKVYNPPYLFFERESGYKGEFFFDKGFEFSILHNPSYYDTLNVRKNNTVYYSPVLGLCKDQTAKLVIDKDDFPSFAKEDLKFKLVIKASKAGYIKINGLDSLILDAQNFSLTKDISIKAVNYLDDIKDSIYAYFPSINKKVGNLEYYCQSRVSRKVHLIYVKFKDESTYPTLNYVDLQSYLNSLSMNQLFVNVLIDTVHLSSSFETSFFTSKTSYLLYSYLVNEKYGASGLPNNSFTDDYYFLTNLDRGSVGGFHNLGEAGGIQTRWKGSDYGETQEEITAHEFGHWLGLMHTFPKEDGSADPGQIIIGPVAKTRENFMDYNIRRKSWFKFQFLKVFDNQ